MDKRRVNKTKAYLFALQALIKLTDEQLIEAQEQLDGLSDEEFSGITFKEIREGIEHLFKEES